MATRNNTVPSGQIGTGAAFLLGGSRALDNWIAQDQRNAQVRAQNASTQAAYDQRLGKSYSDNLFKGVPGQMWNAELQAKIDEHAKQGANYLAQGVDIYNPNYRDKAQVEAANAYQRDRAVLNSMLDAQKAFQKDADAQQTLYKGDPYSFTPESLETVNNFEQGTSLYDAVNKGIKYPSLERVFDYNKNVTEQIPVMTTENTRVEGDNRITEKVANVPAIERFANNLLMSGPNRNWVEKQIGGSVDGLLRTLDEDVIRKQLDDEFKSPSSLDMFAELRNKGKVPGFNTPEYNKFLNDAVKEQLTAEKKFDKILSGTVQDGIAKANPDYKKVPDFSLAEERRSQRRLQLAEEAANRERTRFSERNKKDQDQAVLYRQKIVNDMLSGVEGSGETLRGIVKSIPEFDGELLIETDNERNPSVLKFKIPDKVVSKNVDGKLKTEMSLGRVVTINTKEPGARSQLNRMISEISGENIPESKFQTGNASGKVTTPSQNTSFSKSEENGINAVMKSNGISREEAIKALKDAGKIN